MNLLEKSEKHPAVRTFKREKKWISGGMPFERINKTWVWGNEFLERFLPSYPMIQVAQKNMGTIVTRNPFTGKKLQEYTKYTPERINSILQQSHDCSQSWELTSMEERCELLTRLAQLLLKKRSSLAELMTEEMGKPIAQSGAEIEKCAWVCDFYAANAPDFLADALIKTSADESFISYDPLGMILGIMPWNYPFWQVMRFAVPTLTAGNTVLVKHAENVTGCALEIQNLFHEAGYPKGCFQIVVADHGEIGRIIGNDLIKAVSLTGSEKAGRAIASMAGQHIKKTVLELGGNNACVVWDDADLDTHLDTMVRARMQNTGQSCIAAKRFIVTEGIYETFVKRFTEAVHALPAGDPMDENVFIGPMARTDLAETVETQVNHSLQKGARLKLGGRRRGAFYEPTVLTEVTADMPVFKEEVFGPVAAISMARSREEAIALATDSNFGLGTMLFTNAVGEARKLIGRIPDGAFFVNEMVKSDPRLPFGGTKYSGYGRELSKEGILEFVNKKTVYITH